MTTRSNATVLGVAPMAKTLPVVGGVLIALFVVVKPEATAGLDLLERVVFWSIHIGLGLVSIVLASWLLQRFFGRSRSLIASLLTTGMIGAAMLAPLYVLLEYVLPMGSADVPDSWLDQVAVSGPLAAVVVEYIEVTPMFLAAWVATNLPLLLGGNVDVVDPTDSSPDTQPNDPRGPGRGSGGEHDLQVEVKPSDETARFFDSIPKALGTDVVAVSSDMHYLHIHTVKGKCMVLGTLRDARAALSGLGQSVHRSHWVAHDHVRRLIKRGSSWECYMSNDLRIPVSRRKHAKVKQWYGEVTNVVKIQGSRKTG